ncbi:MAG: hypothetical protein QME81_17755 [bacterium]|nr:hypothetical protein [bacterium]
MLATMPRRLKEKFGDDLAEDVSRFVENVVTEKVEEKGIFREEINARFNGLEHRLDRLEQGLVRLESRVDGIYKEIGEFYKQIGGIYKQIGDIHKQIGDVHKEMGAQLKWMVGTISFFGTLIAVLMAIFKFV